MIGSANYVIVSQIFFNDFSILPFSFPFNSPANNFHITRLNLSKPNQFHTVQLSKQTQKLQLYIINLQP